MKFTIGQIKKVAYNKPFSFSGEVDVSELENMNNDIRRISPVHINGNCTIQGEQYIFTFIIIGEMVLPCARTLVDVDYPFEIKANEVFSSSPYDDENVEDEIHSVDGEVIDLTPLIKENILLSVPFRVYAEDAPDILGQKGTGWEVITEDTKEKKIDPRLKKLESFFKDEKEK